MPTPRATTTFPRERRRAARLSDWRLRRRLTRTRSICTWPREMRRAGSGRLPDMSTDVIEVGTGWTFQVTLTWDADSDVDLHVVEPGGDEIYWGNPSSDQRRNTGSRFQRRLQARTASRKREHHLAGRRGAPRGTYTVRVNYWAACDVAATNLHRADQQRRLDADVLGNADRRRRARWAGRRHGNRHLHANERSGSAGNGVPCGISRRLKPASDGGFGCRASARRAEGAFLQTPVMGVRFPFRDPTSGVLGFLVPGSWAAE